MTKLSIRKNFFRTNVRPLIVAQGSTAYQSTDSHVYKTNEGIVNLPDSVNLIFYIWHIFAGFQKVDHCLEVSVLSALKTLTIVQNKSSGFAASIIQWFTLFMYNPIATTFKSACLLIAPTRDKSTHGGSVPPLFFFLGIYVQQVN